MNTQEKHKHAIVSLETGEIVRELPDKFKVYTGGQVDYLEEHVVLNRDREFTKVFSDFARVAEYLTGASVVIMCRLSEYIVFNSNLIAFENGSPLNHANICDITGYGELTVKKSMAELVEHKVLARCKVGRRYRYFANPFVFCRGTKFNKTLLAMFNRNL